MNARLHFAVILLLMIAPASQALDFYFDPDTLEGDDGGEIVLTGWITASGLMRSFTVYLGYDTNEIDFIPPPIAGPVIAGHAGLQFNYFDHAPIHPDLLEVTATIFGNDLWQGPGELFQLRFSLRSCADAPITAPYAPFFIDGNGNVVPTTFSAALVGVCPRIPHTPSDLVIYHTTGPGAILRWNPVTLDTLNRPLFVSPSYRVLGQQILPTIEPETVITVTSDTAATHAILPAHESWNYRVVTFTP